MESNAVKMTTEVLEQEPTPKNDLAQERYQDLMEHFGDEKVAKAILESRKEFKAWLERLRWNVKRVDELARELEQIKGTTKNDLGVDCIDRAQAQIEIEMNASRYTIAKERGGMGQVEWSDQLIKVSDAVDVIRHLPSVTPQEPRKGYLSIDDVMSVFDDFMCGEVDEDGTETFLEMLKDKAESEG